MKNLIIIALALVSSSVFCQSIYDFCPNRSDYAKCSKNVNYAILAVRHRKFKEEMAMKRKIAELNARQEPSKTIAYK